MEIGFNKDTAAWVGASLSVLLASIQLLKWIYNRKKRLVISTDYDFQFNRLTGIIITSINEKPIVINGYAVYKLETNSEKEYIDLGNYGDLVYKRLNYYDLFRINIAEDVLIRFDKERKLYIEIYLLGRDKPKILEIK